LLLSPLYALFPKELGNGIYSILLCSLLCGKIAFAIGKRLGGNWGGVLAALALLSAPQFFLSSRQLMSDMPTLCVGLLAGWRFLTLPDAPRPKDYLAAGVLAALGFAFRTAALPLILPFLFAVWQRRRQAVAIRALIPLLSPVLAVQLATAIYNQSAFGDWRRTGYHYWCSVPYDYFGMTFSARYLGMNLRKFLEPQGMAAIAIGILGLALLRRRNAGETKQLTLFLALGALPITLIHLFYFVADLRFHLLLVAGLLIAGGAGLGAEIEARLPEIRRKAGDIALACLLVCLCVGAFAMRPEEPVGRRFIVETIYLTLPKDALLLTGLDPVYLEPFVQRGTAIEIIPLSREVEYASKLITPRRIPAPDPPPRSPIDHRCPGLLRAGAQEVIPATADEQLEAIAERIRSGKQAFVDISALSRGAAGFAKVSAAFNLVPVHDSCLLRLELPPNRR
jgi:4-amino-4-deoxy-L-arabinose transferase-like glycosyltransferase